MARYDWQILKTNFICQNEFKNLKSYAAAVGVPYETLRDRAGKEKWVKQHKEWLAKYGDKEETDADVLQSIGKSVLNSLAPELLSTIQEFRDITNDKTFFKTNEGKTNLSKLKKYYECFDLLVTQIQRVYGLLDPVQQQRISIMMARLDISKQMAGIDDNIIDAQGRDNFVDAMREATLAVFKDDIEATRLLESDIKLNDKRLKKNPGDVV